MNLLTDFHEIWYDRYAVEGYSISVLLNPLSSAATPRNVGL
jgi:hypothetical protein